jgi:hypothetical protein
MKFCWVVAKGIIEDMLAHVVGGGGGGGVQGIYPTIPSIDGRLAIWSGVDGYHLSVGSLAIPDIALVGHNHNSAYATLDHNHSGVYALFGHNHDLVYSGLGHNHNSDYASIGHNHSGVYEPVISTKNSGFNLSVGAISGTVAAGDHRHDTQIKKTSITRSFSCAYEDLLGGRMVLPGVSRYNKGYSRVSVYNGSTPVSFTEVDRPAAGRVDATTAYWTHQIEINSPQAGVTYTAHWVETEILDRVRGIREARLTAGNVVDTTADCYTTSVVPNGVVWDSVPSGCRVEVWRKTRKKQRAGSNVREKQSGCRYLLWHTCSEGDTGFNFHNICSIGDEHHTAVFKLAYLDSTGARTPLSDETIIFYPGSSWGYLRSYAGGIVKVK